VHLDRLSENAYFLNVGAYNILAIGFADHILVVENPLADSVSLEAIERMKKHFMRQASSAVSERSRLVADCLRSHSPAAFRHISEAVTTRECDNRRKS
jgi:hypothetical protein